jgi:hypothetical protein
VADFLETVVPEPVVLLGRQLKPLTLGHIFLLERLECLPVRDTEQLVLAVLICSHDHDEVLPMFEDRWWNWRLKIWRWRLGKFDWQEKFDLWDAYFTQGMATPCAINKRDSDSLSDSATPFLQHLKVTLQSKLNYTPTEVLNAPFSQAVWDYYTFHEIEGSVDIADSKKRREMADWITDNHEEVLKQAMEQSAKVKETIHAT